MKAAAVACEETAAVPMAISSTSFEVGGLVPMSIFDLLAMFVMVASQEIEIEALISTSRSPQEGTAASGYVLVPHSPATTG